MTNSSIEIDVSTAKFWQNCYQTDDAGWDLNGPTPALQEWCDHLDAPKVICVPGSGNGHDAVEFARKGNRVTAVDFASAPIVRMQKIADKELLDLNAVQKDIFSLPSHYSSYFDVVVEYICFCAIDPECRQDYVNMVNHILKPGGEFVGFLYPILKDPDDGELPFAVNLEETLEMFGEKFILIESRLHPLSIERRKGNEQFVRLSKRG